MVVHQDWGISNEDLERFLFQNGVLVHSFQTYQNGMASRNYRIKAADGQDLTLRCDLRRDLRRVKKDHDYAMRARSQGISVPVGPWIYGNIKGVATTVRPTIEGTSLDHATLEKVPAPAEIGRLLGRLHKVPPPLDDRVFFYQAVFEADHPLWTDFLNSALHFRDTPDYRHLISEARNRVANVSARSADMQRAPKSMIHGDFNPPNILNSNGELVVIDWEKACAGHSMADVVQGIYYFSEFYGRHGIDFVPAFLEAYGKMHILERHILEAWFECFPAFIFLRDTVSASVPVTDAGSRSMRDRFQVYLKQDSAPRFAYFLANETGIRQAIP